MLLSAGASPFQATLLDRTKIPGISEIHSIIWNNAGFMPFDLLNKGPEVINRLLNFGLLLKSKFDFFFFSFF